MAVRLITYDLNNETKRPNITAAIKEAFSTWAKLSESSYAVCTPATPDQIHAKIKSILDSDDHFYVITLTHPYSGFGPSEVNEWLNENLAYTYA